MRRKRKADSVFQKRDVKTPFVFPKSQHCLPIQVQVQKTFLFSFGIHRRRFKNIQSRIDLATVDLPPPHKMADEEPPRSPTPEPEPDAARGASPERGRDEDRDRSPPPRGRDSRSRSRSPRQDDRPQADGGRGRSPGAYGGGGAGRKIGIAGRWNSRGFGT